MPAPYAVIWSNEALKTVNSIAAYLESRWSQREADVFLESLQAQEIILSDHPKPILYLKRAVATGGVC